MLEQFFAVQRNGLVNPDRWTALIRDHLEKARGHAPKQRQHTDPPDNPGLR